VIKKEYVNFVMVNCLMMIQKIFISIVMTLNRDIVTTWEALTMTDPKHEFFEALGQLVFWGVATGALLFLIWMFV